MRPKPNRLRVRPRLLPAVAAAVALGVTSLGGPASVSASSAVPADGDYIYVPSIADNTLTTIDTTTNDVVSVKPYGRIPFVSASNGDHTKTVTINLYHSSLEVHNNVTGVSHRVKMPATVFILVTMKDGRHMVGTTSDSKVIVFDTVTEKIVKTFKVWSPLSLIGKIVVPPPGAIALELSPDDKVAYIAYGVGRVNAYRLSDGKQVKPLIGAEGIYPAWVNISEDGRWLFALNIGVPFTDLGKRTANAGGDVTVIDTRSWKVVKHIAVPIGMTGELSPDGERMYFAGKYGITIVDTATLETVGHISDNGLVGSILFSADGERAYYGSVDNHFMPERDVFSLIGLGKVTSLGHPGAVQEFDPETLQKIGDPITVDSVPGVIVGGPGWN